MWQAQEEHWNMLIRGLELYDGGCAWVDRSWDHRVEDGRLKDIDVRFQC